ncbi:hypothetical protein LTS15_003208 [Exophiala xenobiotica]|nr:hypothetical protein LTS15_003208 [Exophiala xenobiotica]
MREGSLPSYLLLTIVATAARFSKDPFFENRQTEAIETFARFAWLEIFEKAFSDEASLNIHAVQSTNMLAVIDFTVGRHKLGWVKIGLAVRFAQGLRLNAEPDSTLSAVQQEEHRRTFWSVYLLDKLVSCSPHRPPTILDDDCTVRLPCDESDFVKGLSVEGVTLSQLNDTHEPAPVQKLGQFTLTILMASALGRIVRYNLQQTSSNNFAPWDSRGDLASTWSTLMTFETYSNPADMSFTAILDRDYTTNGVTEGIAAGHFVLSQVLYHLNQCLLHHPFLLHQKLRPYKEKVPPSFIKEVLRRSREHAGLLTELLRVLQHRDCCCHSSFFGYCAMSAGMIHRLHQQNENESWREAASDHFQTSLAFLDRKPVLWGHFPRMATALRNFQPEPSTARTLIMPSLPRDGADVVDSETLWNLMDYGWLADSARPVDTTPSDPYRNFNVDNWTGMDDMEYNGNTSTPDSPYIFSFADACPQNMQRIMRIFSKIYLDPALKTVLGERL